MTGHYGFIANPNYGYSQYSGQTHYGSYPPSALPYTAPPGPGNPDTVEQISTRIRNMHPEEMAVLADQWQNAWAFLAGVRAFLLKQSDVLRDESWRSPAARDAFLMRGPGETLAYLDMWMDAAQQNVTALRHLVNVSAEARYAMARLETDYQREMRDATNVGFLENLQAWLTEGQGWDAASQEFVSEEQAAVRDRYRIEAQRLAQHYGDQFFDYIAVLSNGSGPPVQPMNAVLSGPGLTGPGIGTPEPGRPGLTGPGLTGPGLTGPGLTGPGLTGPGLTGPGPSVRPAGDTPPGSAPPGLLPPGGPLPQPGAVPPGSLLPGVTPPGTVPPGVALPQPGRVLPPPATLPPGPLPVPGTVPSAVPGTLPPATGGPTVIPPGTGRPGLPSQIGRPGRGPNVVPPGGLPPGRTIRRPPGPASPATSPGGGREIRRSGPAAAPAPTGPPSQRPTRNAPGTTPPPQTGRPGRTTPGTTPPPASGRPGGPSQAPGTTVFGPQSTPAAPPVLKNPVDDRGARPGSAAEIRATAAAQRPDGTAPQVLHRPTSPAAPAPWRPPRAGRGPTAWSDMFGAEEARKRAGDGVIDAPPRARPDGGPWGLRSRAATGPEDATEPNRPGTVAPELGKRRAGSAPIDPGQTFEVRTPGGGVLAGRGDDYPEEDIGRVLRGR